MRRTLLTTSLITAAGIALTAASPTCGSRRPSSMDFGPGSLIIPMDNCYQKRDATSARAWRG